MSLQEKEYLPVRGEKPGQVAFTRVAVDKMDAVDREYVAAKLELRNQEKELILNYLTKKDAQ